MANIEPKKCEVCGKEFVTEHYQKKVCSEECRRIKKKAYTEELYKKKREETRERLGIRICLVCGKEFPPRNCNAVTCSPTCTRERHKQTKKLLRAERKEEKKRKKTSKLEPAWKVNEKARALGMSYGKYQMMKQLEAQRAERSKRNGH